MFATQVKLIIRQMRKQPFFSGINILGLAVGLAACWLIGLFVLHEHSYDRFIPAADRICAVSLDLKMGDQEGRTTNTPPPLGPRMLADFPEIECAARTFYLQESTVRLEKTGQAPLTFSEIGAYAADSSFLELFRFPMLEGDATTALDQRGKLVLSQKASEKYFGENVNPLGQILYINDRPFTISAVVRELPSNSTIQFDFLVPMADFKVVERFSWSWIWLQMDTWVRLRETASPERLAALEAKFPVMVNRYAPAAFARIGQNFEEQMRKGDRWDVRLLPLTTLHLGHPDLASRLFTLGDGGQVRMFGIVGLLILLLAAINFMNLSTARSTLRAREVGVRKVLGSQREALIRQFMSESWMFCAIGIALAACLAWAFLPAFNQFTGLELTSRHLFSASNLGIAAALAIITGFLGGLYPAFLLSKFKPVEAFRATYGNTKGSHGMLRNGLVVFQFSVSIALMLGYWAVVQQLDFARHNSPGLKRENVLILPVLRNMEDPDKVESFRQRIGELSGVNAVSRATFLPSLGSFGDFYEPEQGQQSRPVVQNLMISSFLADSRFVPVLGLEIIAGRNFQDDTGLGDSCSVILNEAAVQAIGWDDPIGKWMRYPGNGHQRFQVVGVMRDFHLGSVRTPIEPAAIFHQSSNTYKVYASYVVARLQPGSEKSVIEKISPVWASVMPNAPFEYDFLDASFARIYRSEEKLGSVLGVFTGLAMFVGCLGLFALAAFMAERRTKEIGIRKVLGASVTGITSLLAKDFLKLVLIAIVIASPIAYYFMQRWLSDFTYRIDIQWWMFAGAGLLAIAIAYLTVGGQALRAALANPMKSLKSE